MRDRLRYRDEVQCAAARVVAALRKHARRRNGDNNPDGAYDSFHIRRGDLIRQYKMNEVSAEDIYRNSKEELVANATVFIATDERNRSFFEPLASRYDVVYLSDFRGELAGIDETYYGLIDALVASRGRLFFGKLDPAVYGANRVSQTLTNYTHAAKPKAVFRAPSLTKSSGCGRGAARWTGRRGTRMGC